MSVYNIKSQLFIEMHTKVYTILKSIFERLNQGFLWQIADDSGKVLRLLLFLTSFVPRVTPRSASSFPQKKTYKQYVHSTNSLHINRITLKQLILTITYHPIYFVRPFNSQHDSSLSKVLETLSKLRPRSVTFRSNYVVR